jgi:hypothetical protein
MSSTGPAICAVSNPVFLVVASGSPSQVVNMIVCWIAIAMADLSTFEIGVSQEREPHEPMDGHLCRDTAATQADVQMPRSKHLGGHLNAADVARPSRRCDAVTRTNGAVVAYLVQALIIRNITPFFFG